MDPLTSIEDRVAHHDLGVTGFRMYRGAREEGASAREARMVVFSFFHAMIKASLELPEEDTNAG